MSPSVNRSYHKKVWELQENPRTYLPVQVVIATFPVIYSTYDTLLDLVRSLFQGMGDTTFFLGRRPFFLYGLFGQMESANQISIFLPHLIAININYYV